jgi:hypothetical protein
METSNDTAREILPSHLPGSRAGEAKGVAPSGCAGGSPPVHVIGSLGFDFGTYARRDAFQAVNGGIPVSSNTDLSSYLVVRPVDSESVIWTLSVNNTVVYAIRPEGPYARATYRQLQAYLLNPDIDMISAAGRIAGEVTLLNGQVVPVVQPEPQGLRALSSANVVPPPATLTGSVALAPSSVYLTREGTLDWMNLCLSRATDVNTKQRAPLPVTPVGDQITMQTPSSSWTREIGFATACSWTDGAPTSNFTPAPGVSPGFASTTGGFELHAYADQIPRVLRLYVRTTGGPSRLTITYPTIPSLLYEDSSLWTDTGPTHFDGVYTILVCAAPRPSSAHPLHISWATEGASRCGLQAVTVALGMPGRSPPLRMYLDRLSHELRNMGVSSRDRALNYASTYLDAQPWPGPSDPTILGAMFGRGWMLDDLVARRNDECRPGSDCWDVLARFFDPRNNAESARAVFQVTVDVSLARPRIIGKVQRWNEP